MFSERRASVVLRMGGSTMVERRRINGREHVDMGLNGAIISDLYIERVK